MLSGIMESAFFGISILWKSQIWKHSGRSKASDRKVIAPTAYGGSVGCMATLATGIILAHMNGYLDAILLGAQAWKMIGSMWLCNYVFQRLVHYLAKSENSSRHCRCGSGRQSGFGAKSYFSPEQCVALDTNAVAMVAAQNIY